MTQILKMPYSSKTGRLLHNYQPASERSRLIHLLVSIAAATLFFVLSGDDYSEGFMHFPVWPGLCFMFSLAAVAQFLRLFAQEEPVQVFEDGIAIGKEFLLWNDLNVVEFQSMHIEGSVHTGQPKKDLYSWSFKAKNGSTKSLHCTHGPDEYVPEEELNSLLKEMGLLRRQ